MFCVTDTYMLRHVLAQGANVCKSMRRHEQKSTLILLFSVSHETLRKIFTLGNCKVLAPASLLSEKQKQTKQTKKQTNKKLVLISVIQKED